MKTLNRRCFGALVVGMCFPIVATAQISLPTTASGSRAGSQVVAKAKAKKPSNIALKVLRKKIDSVEWNEEPLETVFDWVKEQDESGELNVIANWTELEIAGPTRETPVTLSLSNASVAEVLNEVLTQLRAVSGEELGYRGMANFLRFSSEADFDRKLYLRVYDVTDILIAIPNFGEEAPQIDIAQTASSSGGGGGGGTGNQQVFTGGNQGNQSGQQDDQELEERLAALQLLITETVEPFHWIEAGGDGTIRVFARSLVIRASVKVHEEIAGHFTLGGKK